MIDLYSGTPGSGKSLHAAERIVMRSRFGEPVIGNFPCDLSRYKKAKFTYVPNNKLTPEFLISYSQDFFKDKPIKEGAILLIIDECQLMFNSRDWQKKGREEWLSFFTLHRHLGYDIVLIAQMDRMIDRQIRGLIEYEYVHRKLNNYGWRGFLLRCVTLGANFISVKIWYPMKEKVSQDIFRASKRYYSIYDTYVLFDGNGVKNSEKVQENEVKPVFSKVLSSLKFKPVILLRSFRCDISIKSSGYSFPSGASLLDRLHKVYSYIHSILLLRWIFWRCILWAFSVEFVCFMNVLNSLDRLV